MLEFSLSLPSKAAPRVLCLGAHSDDVEIGACATILRLARSHPGASVRWIVFGASGERGDEARASAEHCTQGYRQAAIDVHAFRDGYFPAEMARIKDCFEAMKQNEEPDLILTHYRGDLHQDHRLISELTWQTFRNHLILEYEIPKFDGDLGSPNLFSCVSDELCDEKVAVLERFFGTQRSRRWFSRETFTGLMRLRGIECNSPSGLAEAFYCRKALF